MWYVKLLFPLSLLGLFSKLLPIPEMYIPYLIKRNYQTKFSNQEIKNKILNE